MEIKNQKVEKLAKVIWDYMHLNHKIEKSDLIFVMGSHDIQVADRGAELFLEGYAPLVLVSGGLGNITKNTNNKSEAETFTDRLIYLGVPEEKILIEDKSENTGQNIEFAKRMLIEKGINIAKVILVQKPYMERRAFATFKKLWSINVVVTSPQIRFENYNTEIGDEEIINIMVGDLQRIREYPNLGFQIDQVIPDDVWNAYEALVKMGYDKHLIK